MNSTNLMPLARQRRAMCSRRLRFWGIGVGLTFVCCAGAYAACIRTASPVVMPPAAAVAAVVHELSRYEAESSRVRSQMAAVDREINAARSLSEQPDLSRLLGVVSRATDEQIVLGRCEMSEAKPAGSSGGSVSTDPGPVTLRLEGYGKTQVAVAGFVLRLETTGVFDRVSLVQSRREPVLNTDSTAFEIVCLMQPSRRGAK